MKNDEGACGLKPGAVKPLLQYEREPSAGVYVPLQRALLALAGDIRAACGERA